MRGRRLQKPSVHGFWVAAALSLLSGCEANILLGARDTGDDAGSRGIADGGVPDSFTGDPCTDYASVFCDLEQSCNLLVFRNLLWGDLATCKERRKVYCTSRLGVPGSNETAARVGACAALLSRFTCADYGYQDKWPETCLTPAGNLADGTTCAIGAQCHGRGCFPADGTACGQCSTLPGLGAPCNNGVCSDFLECLNGTCVAYVRQGESCRYGGPLCAYGLACIGAATGQGKCLQNLGLGAACDPAALECDDAQGLTCDTMTKQCRVDPGWPAAGETCLANQLCRADAWCNVFTGKCDTKRRAGEACTNNVMCLQPGICVGNVCTTPSAAACP